jgi:hypothetical protein
VSMDDDDILYGIKGKPARMSLPPAFVERRDHARRAALVRRILAEFHDMPGMALSVKQAGRFLGVDETACVRILAGLTSEGELRRNANRLYVCADRPLRRATS